MRKRSSGGKLKKFFCFRANSVLYRLTMAFGLFFMGPLLGLLFLSVQTDLFGTRELLYSLVGLLVSTFFGYIIIRQISVGIARLEDRIAGKAGSVDQVARIGDNELDNISTFADAMSENMRRTSESLGRRVKEIQALRELGALSSFRLTAKSLSSRALHRSMEVTEAEGGVILYIAGNHVVCALRRGEGVVLKQNHSFSLAAFPWKKTVKQNSPLLISRASEPQWSAYFSAECNTAAVIPFGRFGATTAVVLLAAGAEKRWGETTLEFLSTYFQSIGNALKMREVLRRKKETSRELSTVFSIIRVLNATPNEDDLLRSIAAKVEKILPYHWIGLALWDESRNHLYLSHSFSKLGPDVAVGQRIDRHRSLFQLASHGDEVLIVDRLESRREYYEKPLFRKLELQSCMLAGLSSGGRVLGTICLGSRKAGAYGAREKRILTMIAMAVAIAVEHARIFARERAKRHELETFNRISTALASHTIKANSVLPYILDQITGLIPAEMATIMLLEFDTLVVEAAVGRFSAQLKGEKFTFNHGVAGYVVATGEAVVVDDTGSHPHFFSSIDQQTGFTTRSVLCVPLTCGERVIGVIELLNKSGPRFSRDDLQAVKAVASATAIALENTRLYGESIHIARKEKVIRTIFQKYVPEEIVAKILERGDMDHMAVSEKKVVTIFNVDIRGYTLMSKQASTEDVVHILNHFFRRMGNIIIKHKGLLDKFLGDGMLAIFGAPASTANSALDAVRAAQEMVEAVEGLSMLALDRCGVPLKIGISINTGEAIVGNIGFSKKMEYTVIGAVVNETFRLQDLTRRKHNSILIGEETYQQVKTHVRTRPYGLKKLDSTLVKVYEVETGPADMAADSRPPLLVVGREGSATRVEK